MSDPARRSFLDHLRASKTGRTLVLLGGGVVLLGLLSRGCSPGQKEADGPPKRVEASTGKDELPPPPNGFEESLPVAQQYRTLVASYGERVSTTEAELRETKKALEALRIEIADARRAGLEETSEKPRQAEDPIETFKAQAGLAIPPIFRSQGESAPEVPSHATALRVLEFSPSPSDEKEPRRAVHLPAGSGGFATVLNGVFARTTGEPSPVRLRLDAALVGPNRSRIPLRNAYLIGKAQGEANSSRVTIQLEKLATVTGSGNPVETRVLGYVVGEDGLEGVPGTYEWRATEVLPLAAGMSAISGGADAFAQKETATSLSPLGGATNIVTGNPLRFAGFRALSGGSDKLSELVVERLREIRPAVSIPGNQRVQVVFLEGVTLESLGQEELDNERDMDPFGGLDLHR